MVFPSRCNDGLIQQGVYKIVQKSWHEIPIEIASWIVQDRSLTGYIQSGRRNSIQIHFQRGCTLGNAAK